MTRNDEIRRIEALAARIKPPAGLRLALSLYPVAGQVWSSVPIIAGQEPLLFLVLEGPLASARDVYHVAPLHRRVDMAGPDDVILPREVAGHRLVVAMGASIPASRNALVAYRGSIPAEWLERLCAFANWLNGSLDQRPDVLTGINYLDDRDTRWVFKEQLGQELLELQALPDEGAESLIVSGTIIQFPPLACEQEELALAADSTTSAQRPLQTYVVSTPDGARVRISEAEDPAFVAMEVVEDAGGTLAGAVIQDEAGHELARLEGAIAYFRLPTSRSFRLCTPTQPDGIDLSHGGGSDDDDERA